MVDETLVKRKKKKKVWMRVVDQQVHTIVLSQLREAAGHGGISRFHGYSMDNDTLAR